MRQTLAEWLDYQQRIHARGIDLGLDRVREVWRRMGAPPIARTVITVGGTNGKGSTVAFLEAMLRAGGMRVGAYTSPHILRYNERVRLNGADAEDDALVAAFERIEAARAETPLTYFEFGTLAAFDLFARAHLDVALLEVGLGGRLDAVNIVDADAAIVTTVDLDHMEYLGNDRESIGREKAGIFRAGRPAIIGEDDPPHSLLQQAQYIGAELELFGHDFGWSPSEMDQAVFWRGALPKCGSYEPAECRLGETQIGVTGDLALHGTFQWRNAAAAIAALCALGERVRWNAQAIVAPAYPSVSADSFLRGRLQVIGRSPDVVVDVAHNPQAARELARWLDANRIPGKTHAVFGALGDKDVAGIVRALDAQIAHWHLAGLAQDSPRGLPVADLAERVREAVPEASFSKHPDVRSALDAAHSTAQPQDRILVFGSFFMVAAALR
jgi:dihydrofolate synthase/folylpolyglutamate synthase